MKHRRVDLDVMRIIACFLVIFNHLPGYGLYGNADTEFKSWIYMFLTMITRINVPIFFMISGTLLLTDRQETYKTIITKRFLRILYVLLIFTAVLCFTTLGGTLQVQNLSIIFVLYWQNLPGMEEVLTGISIVILDFFCFFHFFEG